MKLKDLIKQLIFETVVSKNINEIDNLIDKAKSVANYVHRNQRRKVGNRKYIVHPFAVYLTLNKWHEPEKTQAIGLLHDTIEDAEYPKAVTTFIEKHFPSDVVKGIKLLSHEKSVDYNTYVKTLIKHPLALKVKLADIQNNLKDYPSPKQIKKYYNALVVFQQNGVQIPNELKKLAIELTKKLK